MGNGIAKYLKYLFNCTLKLVYPWNGNCIICSENAVEEQFLCSSCLAKMKLYDINDTIGDSEYSVKFYSSAYYSGIVKELVLRLKYRRDFTAGEAISLLLYNTVSRHNLEFDVITYVPSGKEALKKRGYNQSEFLAKCLGEKADKRIISVLKKVRETKDQIGLDSESRWANLKEGFEIIDKKLVANKKVLLVDDVITTGATAFFCAKALLNAGCSNITVLTAAKSTI